MARTYLEPLPATFATTVAALHRVAEQIVAPARKPGNEIALSATPGGFGTPSSTTADVAGRCASRAPSWSTAPATTSAVARLRPSRTLGDWSPSWCSGGR